MLNESAERTVESTAVVTPEDKRKFDMMGFHVFRQLLSPSEMAELEAAFMRVMGPAASETGYDGTRALHIYPVTEGDAWFDQLIDDPRINDIAEGLIGEDCNYHSSGGHFYVGNSRWHSDGGNFFPSIHMAFYLDPVTADTGCLNVIPGSHHLPFHDALDKARRDGIYDFASPDVPGRHPLESQPGDVCVFRHALFHSSFGGWAGRRMLSVHYYNPSADWHENAVVGSTEGRLHYMKAGHRVYSEYLVETAGPRRMKRLRRYIDRGYCDEWRKPLTNLFYQYTGPATYGEVDSGPLLNVTARS